MSIRYCQYKTEVYRHVIFDPSYNQGGDFLPDQSAEAEIVTTNENEVFLENPGEDKVLQEISIWRINIDVVQWFSSPWHDI